MKCTGPIAVAAAVMLAGCGDTKSEDAEYRAAFIGQCEQQLRVNPQVPAGVDVRQACACGAETAFAATSDVADYAQSPAGQQAFAQALATCIQQRAGGAALPAAQPAPAAPPASAAAPVDEVDLPEEELDAEGEQTE